MIPLFTLRGFYHDDPLDRTGSKYLLIHILVTALISILSLYIIINVLNIAVFKYNWLFWAEVVSISLIFAPIVAFLRKSSSVLLMLLMIIVAVPLDIYLESNFRAIGVTALWDYNSESIIGGFHPLIRIAIVWIGDAFIFAPFSLWISRYIAKAFFKKPNTAAGLDEYYSLFKKEWTSESIKKPSTDFSFWFLRILGLIYLFYLLLLVVSILGINPYPVEIQKFLSMSYE